MAKVIGTTVPTFTIRGTSLAFLLTSVLLLGGCAENFYAKLPARQPTHPDSQHHEMVSAESDIIQTQNYIILITKPQDTLHSLAKQYLGDDAFYWVIADFNNVSHLAPGQEIVIPRTMQNPIGVYATGYQTVPVLSYHQFGQSKGKTTVTPEMFHAQMAYLKAHDYRVIPLSDLLDFLNGKQALPRRAVVITIDDGYKSAYTIAYPILKKYGFPATLFVYSDFIGSHNGLNWQEMREMVASKLIDIQPHSKTHLNLNLREALEDDTAYVQRVEKEISTPLQQIQTHFGLPIHTFAYPYGETNDFVIARLQHHDYQMGATVQRGGNPFFVDPFLLRRTMIFGDRSLEDFQKSLEVFRREKLH
jgi:peptidoglycan/xylan/chitin deacetylase (PgdA/CDA1 family)